MESINFSGILQPSPDNPHPGFIVLRRLMEKAGHRDFYMAVNALRMGKVRERRASIIEKVDGEMMIHERSLRRGIGDHNLTTAMAGYVIGGLINLEGTDRTDLIIGPMCHDATKPLEVTLMGFRNIARVRDELGRERKVLNEILSIPGLYFEEKLIEELVNSSDPIAFAEIFDENFNTPFLELAFSALEPNRRQRLVSITSSDSVAALPLAVARAHHFSQLEKKSFYNQSLLQELERLTGILSENQQLPIITDETTDRLGLILLFCDALVTDHFVTPGQRVGDIIKRNVYGELEQAVESRFFQNKAKYWPVALAVALTTQELITIRAKKNGKLSNNVSPEDLPGIIFEKVQEISQPI